MPTTAAPIRTAPAVPAADPFDGRYVTAEEYLRFEEHADAKHEWIDGEVREMAGVAYEHAVLAADVEDALTAAFAGTSVRRLSHDIKVRIPDGPYYYCDGVFAARPHELEPPVRPGGRRTVLLNPTVVVEVLSDSTGNTDRGEKLDAYRTIPSLTDYLIVSQDAPEVEHHARTAGGWRKATHRGREATFTPAAGGAPLGVGTLYAGLDEVAA